LVNDGTGPTLATKGLTAGTGVSLSSNATAVTITNSAPDQTVVLTAGTGISTSGTYPNFTITNTSASSSGTVTSVGGAGTVAGLTLTGTVTTSGSITLGGTLSTPISTVNDSTTVGQNLVKLTNPTALTYVRINADNTVSAISLATLKTELGIVPGTIALTADQATSGTAYQNITGLNFAMTAGKSYKWRATMIFTCSSGSACFSTNGSAGTTVYRFTMGTGTSTNIVSNNTANNTGAAVVLTAAQRICSADGIYIASAGGTFNISFISTVSGALTAKAGSVLEWEELA